MDFMFTAMFLDAARHRLIPGAYLVLGRHLLPSSRLDITHSMEGIVPVLQVGDVDSN